MSLRIEIISGPGAGEAYEFGDDVEIVEIGRDTAHCQVSFPPDFTVVGRRHLAIRNTAGHYDLETNLKNPVLIDGREPFDGESLGPVHRLQLGIRGPTLEIRTFLEGSLPTTDPTPVGQSASQKFRLSKSWNAGLTVGLATAFLLGAVGFGYNTWRSLAERTLLAEMGQRIKEINGSEAMPAQVLQKAARSVYLVLIAGADGAESPVGTAWVYKPGVLATNAHVAETFNTLSEGQRLIARSTVTPYSAVDIGAVKLHEDYTRFSETWKDLSPVRGNLDDQLIELDAPGAGYDVALMQVTNENPLQPPLEIVDAAGLFRMEAGQAVGYAGFPMEGLALGGINPKAPVPQVQVGHITALTDYFLLPGKPAERHLIQHSIPATGGASGSPMLDKFGRVVGLISGINISPSVGARSPNAASVNFAQRVDLLREVENGLDVATTRERTASWDEGFATFDDPVELLPRSVKKEWLTENAANTAVELASEAGTLSSAEAENDYNAYFRSIISKPGRYLVLAVSPSRKDIDLAVLRNGEMIEKDNSDDWYPYVTVNLDEPDDLDVLVLSSGQTEAPDYKLMIWQIPPKIR